MKVCTHSLAERWDDCSDGACPFCLADRIRELEAERDQANEALSNIGLNWNALKEGSAMQLRAIRANTIEECAKVADGWLINFGDVGIKFTPATEYASDAVKDIAEAIRVLAHASTPFDKSSGAQQDESKAESGE